MKKKLSQLLILILVLCMLISESVFAADSQSTQIKITAAGDCTLGSDGNYGYYFVNMYKRKTPTYFLKNVRSIFENDDLTIVNLEGALTTATSHKNNPFIFKGKKSYTKILSTSSVEAANLANNHTYDYYAKGLNDTKSALKKAGIPYFRNETIAYKKIKGVKVAMIGYCLLDGANASDVRKAVKKAKKNKAKLIIVTMHGGTERKYYPIGKQKSFAKAAVKAGADLVIGHHPHVLQGVQRYKGKYIVYSLGNFCYGGHSNPSDKDTYIFQQTFTIKKGKVLKDKRAKVIPCSISSSSKTNNFQPTPAKGKKYTRILKKINKLSKPFHTKFSKNGNVK